MFVSSLRSPWKLKRNASLHFSCNYHSPTFSCLLSSCSSLSDLKLIHAQILTNGLHQDLPLSTKLVRLAYTLSPTMEYARKVFDSFPQRDVFLWNTILRGYADVGPCEEAIVLYRNMHRSGFPPDNYTFPFVVRSCAVLSALREGREAHCNVVKNGFHSDLFVKSSLVSMYAQGGEMADSEMIFGETGLRNIVTWTAMIAGYIQNGFYEKGLCAFRDMMYSETLPNAVTLVSVLSACAGLEFLNLGKLIHAFGVKLGVDSNVALVNALIGLYGKCGYVDIAKSLFDGMIGRNLVSWNAMIATYEQNNYGKKAIELFMRMQSEKVDFDYITMVSAISACASLGELNMGKWVHDLVKRKGFENNVSITNALIDMYSKCGNIDFARYVFESLPQRSVVSWTAMIGAFASHGYAGDALQHFSRMKEEGIRPNSFTFTAVLTACKHSGLVQEGRKHFESMSKDYSIEPNMEHFSCVVDLLGRAGCLTEAYEFIKTMPVEPDAGAWEALLAGCRIHGNIELAELVADKLLHFNRQNVNLYVLMSYIYAEAGRWGDVEKLRSLIKEKELDKRPGQSLVEVNQKLHTFLSGYRLQAS